MIFMQILQKCGIRVQNWASHFVLLCAIAYDLHMPGYSYSQSTITFKCLLRHSVFPFGPKEVHSM